jgi:hypothetical protein
MNSKDWDALELENEDLRRLQLYVYLVPMIGFFPALWTLYRRSADRRQRIVSRLAVTLALLWMGGSVLLTVGVQTSESFNLPLLLVHGLWTSGYFLISLGLMVRLWRGKKPRLPIVSRLSDILHQFIN